MVTLAFGEVLLLFLQSLRTPVVPYSLFPLISQVTNNGGDSFEVRDFYVGPGWITHHLGSFLTPCRMYPLMYGPSDLSIR
jgi:hypothetical protein